MISSLDLLFLVGAAKYEGSNIYVFCHSFRDVLHKCVDIFSKWIFSGFFLRQCAGIRETRCCDREFVCGDCRSFFRPVAGLPRSAERRGGVKFSRLRQTKFTASLLKDKIYKTWSRGLGGKLNRSLPSLS
jgi:hypothetical protein